MSHAETDLCDPDANAMFQYAKQLVESVNERRIDTDLVFGNLIEIIPHVKSCLHSYIYASEKTSRCIDQITQDITRMEEEVNEIALDMAPILGIEMRYLEGNITYLQDLLKKYSYNLIDKYNLATGISESFLISIDMLLEDIENKVFLEGKRN